MTFVFRSLQESLYCGVKKGGVVLFEFECEEAVDDQDDSLDEGQNGLGKSEVGVASVELPAGEVVVGEPRGQDVQDGSGHAEEQVLEHKPD